MPKSIVLYFLLSLVLSGVYAQNINHQIKKGENVYRISLKYGVSMQAIFKANPGSERLIKAGEFLVIPNSSEPISNINSNNQGTYVVKRGETKYGLSRQFGVSIQQLENANPQIKPMLQAGHILRIPQSSGNLTQRPQSNSETTHTIRKGETIWSISQARGLKVQPVLNANPGIDIYNLQIGQVITIPGEGATPVAQTQYVVKAGDTKFGLSQQFGMSITELEALNPQIRNGLQKGQVLQLTSANTDLSTVSTEPSARDNSNVTTPTSGDYLEYTIQPQETLYSLSRTTGLSINELVELNPELSEGVLAGAVIKLPADTDLSPKSEITEGIADNEASDDLNASESNTANNEVETTDETSEDVSSYFETNSNKDLKKKVTWLVPEAPNQLDANNRTEGQLLDFYRGGHMAIAYLKTTGYQIDETLIDASKKSKRELNELLDSTNLMITVKDRKINLENLSLSDSLSVFNAGFDNLDTKNYVIHPITNREAQVKTILDYIASTGANVIVINDTKRKEDEGLIKKLTSGASFIDINSDDTFNESELVDQLISSRLNMVLVNSDKSSVYLNTTNALLRQYANFDVQLAVIDKSLIPSNQDISDKRFRILNMLFPSILKMETLDDFSDFSVEYRSEYGIFPSDFSYLGYETTYDAILRLFYKDGLKNSFNIAESKLNHIDINYKTEEPNKIENNRIFIYKYKTDEGFEQMK